MRPDSEGHRVPRSRLGLGLSTGPSGMSPTAVHHELAHVASSSRELSSPIEFVRHPTCPTCPRKSCDFPEAVERLPWGFDPSSRHQPAASTSPRSHSRALSVLDVSHVLDGLLRHVHEPCSLAAFGPLRPCGFVSPRCHVQGLPSRGLSLATEPYRVSPATSCPLAVEHTRLQFDPRQRMHPRLQGLAPRGECGVEERQLAPTRSAPLLGFSSSG